jgi:Tfp pilus assembly protein PilZ
MTYAPEKRAHERIAHTASLSLKNPDTENQTIPAQMVNYSEQGMCFRTGEKLKIGQEIFIIIDDVNPESDDPENNDSYTGYIRWSEDLGTSVPGGQYGYGVQYRIPTDF